MTEVGMVGDVGYLDAEGGFYSLFNIFLTENENESHGYSPPTNFKEYTSFKVRENIIDPTEIDAREPLLEGLVNYWTDGKFRYVEQVGYVDLYGFITDKN